MFLSFEKHQWSKYIVALSLLVSAGCKTTNSESGVKAANQTVTETGLLNKSIKLNGKGRNENFVEVTVDKVGLLRISVSMSANAATGFTKPIALAAFSGTDLNTPLASGQMKVDPANPQDVSAEMYVSAPTVGKYYVLVQHNQQLEDNDDSANVRTRIVQPQPSQTGKIINTIPGDYDATDVYDGKAVVIMVTAPKVLSEIHVNSTFYAASPDVISEGDKACPTCSARLQITSGNDVFNMPLPVRLNSGSNESAFQFDTGTYKFELIVDNLAAGSLVDWNINMFPIENNQGGPFSTVGTLGMLQLAFDQNTSRRSSYHGKPFGFAIDSDRSSEAKIDMSLEVKRILNLAKKTDMPKKLLVELKDASGVVTKTEMGNGFGGTNFNGDLITDLNVGNYTVEFSTADIDDADILNLTGSLDAVELTIKDGGPDPSTFKDIEQVTITPPNNYLVDLNVPQGSVYTPVKKPIDLASASVLAGMEKIRNFHHVRIPKGVTRTNKNNVDANTISACLGNEAPHWSDLIIHYYCQYGQARSCYTNTIRSKAQAIGGDSSLDQAAKIQKLQTIRTESFAECAATVATNKDWAWIMDKQLGDQAEVFQYVMNSQTFAFDMEQQQALINKFYRIDDPTDKNECNLKRPRRAIDPGDGTHCLPTKIFATAMTAVGR
jgi:hypothetical protein